MDTDRLVEDHKNLVYHLIRRTVQGRTAHEEIFQEVFLNVLESPPRFEGRSKLSTWIASVAVRLSQVPTRPRTSILQYAVTAVGVIAGLVALFCLVMGGTVQRWLPGLLAAALGISDPRAARTVDIVTLIVSFHALVVVPSIIDNIYRLMRRGGRRSRAG